MARFHRFVKLFFRTTLFKNARFYSISRSSAPEKNSLKLRHVELIHDYIGGDQERISRALADRMLLQLVDEKVILQRLETIKDMTLTDKHTAKIIPLLIYHHEILKNRYKMLLECGVIPYFLSASHIMRFLNLSRSTVSKLKNKELIKRDHLVLKGLWEVAGLDFKNYKGESDNCTINELKTIALKSFLQEKLGFSETDWILNEAEFVFKLKAKSFDTLNRNYRMFKEIIGLSDRRLRNNWFVLPMSPENTENLLVRIEGFKELDMKLMLHLIPKIAVMPWENFQKILDYLEEVKVPKSRALKYPYMFTLNCETIRKRLSDLDDEEFFSYNMRNTRVMGFVYHQARAKKRLDILNELKLEASVKSLICCDENFNEYIEKGGKYFGSDTLSYVLGELDMEREDFMKKIRRHKHWSNIPLLQVGRNLQTLRKRFSDEEIKKNIHVLFYYSSRLNRVLEGLDSREGLDEYRDRSSGRLKDEWVLPLTLYFLESESNFTGESVWETEEANPYQDLPDLPTYRDHYKRTS